MQPSSFTLLKNSNILHKLAFMKQHPIQLSFSNSHLHIQKLYKRKMPGGKEVSRNWLSVHVENNELKSVYYPICIAFFKHIHIAVKKHEESRSITLLFKIIFKPHLNNVLNLRLTEIY